LILENQRGNDPGRRGDDKRWTHILAQLATIKQAIAALEATAIDLKDEIKMFDSTLYGGARDKDSIHFRLKGVEHTVGQLRTVVIGDESGQGGMRKLIEGMNFQLGVLKDLVKSMSESRKDRIAKWSAFGIAGMTTLGLIFTSLDKIALGTEKFVEVFRGQRPLDPDLIMAEILKMRKTRGPEIEKKLKEIERAARRR